MSNIDVSMIRTFVIMGHTGSGKTSLVDALLFKTKVNDRLGSVDSGSSVADWTDAEKRRKITLQAKPFTAVYKCSDGREAKMVFCDTPGYMDFYGHVLAASRVCESAVVLVDAGSGIQLGTRKAWDRAREMNMPRAFVITGLDKEHADFAGVVAKLQEVWGRHCIPVTLPAAGGKGVIDVLSGKDASPEAVDLKGKLVELAAEADDSLLEKYLGGEALTDEELAKGLRKAVNSCKLVPIFAVAALKDVGLAEFLEGMVRLMPSPADRKATDAAGKEIDTSPSAPFAGFVWRTVIDPYVGQLTLVRVYGGTLKSDTDLYNATSDVKERISGMAILNGKNQTPITIAVAGDMVAFTKLKQTKLNDSLCAAGGKILFAPMSFPNPLMSYAVKAKTRGDEDKIGTALSKLAEEDPTIKVERNIETHEMLLAGMGDVHLDVAVEVMKTRNNVEVVLSAPKIPYRETVTALGEGHHKHKKQSGGRGQYGEVYLKVQPKRKQEEEWFEDAIVGGAIPHNFIPAVEKGLVDALTKGSLAGYPVTDVKITVYDGTYHEVDSSEIAFKIAAAKAFRDGMSKARPVLLEPIMNVKIMVPEQFMGGVTGDISHKRGRILGMAQEEGMQIITAEMPLAELSRYAAELRSVTSGQGTFDMSFSRYDVVPGNVAQKIIAAAEKDKVEEQED